MITDVSAHRVAKVAIDRPELYSGTDLIGFFQRIRLYDASGVEKGSMTIHFDSDATPLPVIKAPK